MTDQIKFLKEITDLNAVPGNEKQCRDFMKKHLADCADEVSTCNLGSVIGKKVGNEKGPKVMLMGHMDEVGFMVEKITEDGYIKFKPLGGWWSQVLLSQQVTITASNGKTFHGVVGSKPPHVLTPEQRKKPVELKEMFIDLGISSKKEVEKLGILPGDMITPYIEFRQMADKDYLLAKAWDNRLGCAFVVDVLKNLKGKEHPNTVYGVATVQEEVGLRGAKTTSNIVNPDISFSLDVGIADDIPGGGEYTSFGKGPIVTLMDASMVGHKGLRDYVLTIAKKHKIDVQFCILTGGGTDAGASHIAHNGAPSMAIGIPSRYIHSHTSMIHKKDYDDAVKLMTEILLDLDQAKADKITFD